MERNLEIAKAGRSRFEVPPIESWVPYLLFLMFMAVFYLRLPARVPALGPFRLELLLALLTIIALVPHFASRAKLLTLPSTKALNLLVVWVLVSVPFVEWPGSVIRENWFPFVKVVLMFYLTVFTVDTQRRLFWFVSLFVTCQIVRAFEPLYMYLTTGYLGDKTHLGAGEFAGRLAGSPFDVVNPNGLGFVIATAAIFCHFFLWQAPNKLSKLVYLAILPGLLYALILTMSRGGMLALLVGGFLIWLQSKFKILMVLVVLVGAVAGWNLMSDVHKDRYLSLVSSESQQRSTAEGRFRGMANEFILGFNRPVFGHGLGTTSEAKVNIKGGRSQAAHNLYAELLIEVGLVGLVLFLIFMRRIYQAVRDNIEASNLAKHGEGISDFLSRLNSALLVVFWVYATYSFNYFGLSQAYWYVFGGMCVAYGAILSRRSLQGAPVDERKTMSLSLEK